MRENDLHLLDDEDDEDAAKGDGRDAPRKRDSGVSSNVSGRVKFDERGNAVWEWAVSTGKFGTEVSTSRLKKLEDVALSISDDEAPAGRAASAAAAPPAAKENRTGVKQGYSPYDSGLLVKAQAEAKRGKKDLRRLSEWIKLREQANRNKQGKD